MLPPREKMTICFAHVAYRFADRFALRGTGIDFFEVRNRDDLDARIAGADVLVCSGLWRNDLPKLSPRLRFVQSASAGTDLEHHTALIAGIPWQEGHREFLAKGAHGLGEARQLLIGELFHGWIAPVLLEQGPGFAFFLFHFIEP